MVLVGMASISPISLSFFPDMLSSSMADRSSFTLRSGLDDAPLEKKVFILIVLPKWRHQVSSTARWTVETLSDSLLQQSSYVRDGIRFALRNGLYFAIAKISSAAFCISSQAL